MTFFRHVCRAVLVIGLLLVAFPVAAQQAQPAPQTAPQPAPPTDGQPPKQVEGFDEFVPIEQLPPSEQIPAARLVIAAYSFVWIALLGYVVSVARRLGSVQRDLERLEGEIKQGKRT